VEPQLTKLTDLLGVNVFSCSCFGPRRPPSRYENAVVAHACYAQIKGALEYMEGRTENGYAYFACNGHLIELPELCQQLPALLDEFSVELTKLGADMQEIARDMKSFPARLRRAIGLRNGPVCLFVKPDEAASIS
jgi:hypothetical protein